MGEITGRSMDIYQRIADLTVEEFQALIRQTVQEAMAEVMVEFSAAAERDAELTYQAEMTDLLRSSLHDEFPDRAISWGHFDD